jgi:hypothetical protein
MNQPRITLTRKPKLGSRLAQSALWRLPIAPTAILLAGCCGISVLLGQQGGTTGQTTRTGVYLTGGLPAQVQILLGYFGNRLQSPGNERLTLSGTYVDGAGTNSATLVTQIPSSVRLTVTGPSAKVLTFDGSQANSSLGAIAAADLNVLESLQSDSAESYFYSYGVTAAARYLGGLYRTDNGKNPAYAGPWYDIYELTLPVAVQPGSPREQKLYYFDSGTKLYTQSRYQTESGGKTVSVQTVYSNWSRVNGQVFPGRIERFENGTSVFSLAVSSSQLSAGANDGIFSQP